MDTEPKPKRSKFADAFYGNFDESQVLYVQFCALITLFSIKNIRHIWETLISWNFKFQNNFQHCHQMLLRLHENHQNVKNKIDDPPLKETDPYRFHSYYLVSRPKTYPQSVTKRVSPLMPIKSNKLTVSLSKSWLYKGLWRKFGYSDNYDHWRKTTKSGQSSAPRSNVDGYANSTKTDKIQFDSKLQSVLQCKLK